VGDLGPHDDTSGRLATVRMAEKSGNGDPRDVSRHARARQLWAKLAP